MSGAVGGTVAVLVQVVVVVACAPLLVGVLRQVRARWEGRGSPSRSWPAPPSCSGCRRRRCSSPRPLS